MAVRIVRHNEADSAPDFSALQEFHWIVDDSFQSHSIDKIKYSGDTIIGCCGMFEVVQATQATAAMFDAACDVLKCMEAKSSKSKLQVCIGLSFGPAMCLNVDCQKSSVDIFGSCVDKALAMSNMYATNQSCVISDGLFVGNLDPARKSKLQPTNQGICVYIYLANDFSEIEEIDFSLNNTTVEIIEMEDKEAKQSSAWNLSHEKSEKVFVVGVDSSNHETKTGIVEDVDESELETFSFEDESNKRKTSIIQVSVTLAIYLIYGFTDFVIFSQEEVLQWGNGGHLVFLRMAVLLPICLMVYWGLNVCRDPKDYRIYKKMWQRLLVTLYATCYGYTIWSRNIVHPGLSFSSFSVDLQFSQLIEAYYYVGFLYVGGCPDALYTKSILALDVFIYPIYVFYIHGIMNWISFVAIQFVIFVVPVWILFWKLSSIKAAIARSEEKSRINQIKKAHEVQSQTEHAQLCLDTVMPRIFQTTIKQNKAFAQTPLPFACVAVVRISNIHQTTHSLKIDAFKDLISEIFAEIEYAALLCGGEPVKTFGCSYTILFRPSIESSDHEKQTNACTSALRFSHNMHDHISAFVCGANSTKITLSIGISSGSCVGGVPSMERLSFDIWGQAVTEANQAANMSSAGKTMIHHRVAEQIKKQSSQKSEQKQKENHNMADRLNEKEYEEYQHVEDVWKSFMTAIDWDHEGTLCVGDQVL